jgi:hypothetical protein
MCFHNLAVVNYIEISEYLENGNKDELIEGINRTEAEKKKKQLRD